MKQRAKVYKGKRVVMGDKNRVTKHEIHVNDIPQQGGESGGGNSGGGGGIPNYEIDGYALPLYCLIEGELAEKIYNGMFNGGALKVSEAESFLEKMKNTWITLIKFPDIPQLTEFKLVNYKSDLSSFSIGGSGIGYNGDLSGSIVTFTKDGDLYNIFASFYPEV